MIKSNVPQSRPFHCHSLLERFRRRREEARHWSPEGSSGALGIIDFSSTTTASTTDDGVSS